MVTLTVVVTIAIAVAISVAIADSIAITVAVAVTVAIAHRLFLLLLAIAVAVSVNHCRRQSVVLPSAIVVTNALAIGHCHLCHRQLSQLPLLFAITMHAVSHFQELSAWRGKNCI
jgi:hypothetical protein